MSDQTNINSQATGNLATTQPGLGKAQQRALKLNQPIGYQLGGFTVGHFATMSRCKAVGTIVGVEEVDGQRKVTLEFAKPQPTDVDGVSCNRFELDFRNISSTWEPPRVEEKVQKFASGDWMHLFGPGSKETRCRIVIDLEQSKLIAAQEWTGLKFVDVLSERLQDLAQSVFDANDAHTAPADWGLEVSDGLPDWADHVSAKGNEESTTMALKVAVACRNASGSADMPVFDLVVSLQEYELGMHYEMAQAKAENTGYEGPFVCFDPTESHAIRSATASFDVIAEVGKVLISGNASDADADEIIVKLADGCTLRSGVDDPDAEGALTAGDYVRLCGPDGKEIHFWSKDEWQTDPALVMGAIMNAAAGNRLQPSVANEDSHSPGK